MTAGTEMVPLLKMPQEGSNTVSGTPNLENKDNTSLKSVHQSDSVRKSLKFTEDNLNNCSDECQNNNKHCTNIASDSKENCLNDNEKIIRKSKFLPAREDDPVLTDQRILTGKKSSQSQNSLKVWLKLQFLGKVLNKVTNNPNFSTSKKYIPRQNSLFFCIWCSLPI